MRVPAFYNGLVKMRVGKSAPTILPSSVSFIVALYFIEIPVAEAEDPEPDRIRGSCTNLRRGQSETIQPFFVLSR